MSDMLEKLLSVEKRAAALVADAEAEVHRRTAQARAEVQHRHTELLTASAAAGEKAVAAERERIAAERARKNAGYREELERRAVDTAAFTRTVAELIEKGTR
jgi:hypothetical protein